MSVITVTQLNTYLKSMLEENPVLQSLFVVGEISNFHNHYQSGHMYFTLKDERSQIKAVMYKSYAMRLKFMPEDGMRVICRGRMSNYDKEGTYQLYVMDIQPDGAGALNLAFEQLKDKLSKEGLFDSKYKKQLPEYPKRIGVATSNTGAAVRDIINITGRRYPFAEIVIAPTVVQGEAAAPDIVKSLKLLDSIDDIDVIIVGRGGGSIEDLWAFNTESVARAVFACIKPVISAVGHETDFTICDFVADVRAETPSAAAEMAVPDINVLNSFVLNAKDRMTKILNSRLEYESQRLDKLEFDSPLSNSEAFISRFDDILTSYKSDLLNAYQCKITDCKYALSNKIAKLDALSPLSTLARGYTLASKDNKIIKTTSDINCGDNINIRFSDGTVSCTVNEVRYEQ